LHDPRTEPRTLARVAVETGDLLPWHDPAPLAARCT